MLLGMVRITVLQSQQVRVRFFFKQKVNSIVLLVRCSGIEDFFDGTRLWLYNIDNVAAEFCRRRIWIISCYDFGFVSQVDSKTNYHNINSSERPAYWDHLCRRKLPQAHVRSGIALQACPPLFGQHFKWVIFNSNWELVVTLKRRCKNERRGKCFTMCGLSMCKIAAETNVLMLTELCRAVGKRRCKILENSFKRTMNYELVMQCEYERIHMTDDFVKIEFILLLGWYQRFAAQR